MKMALQNTLILLLVSVAANEKIATACQLIICHFMFAIFTTFFLPFNFFHLSLVVAAVTLANGYFNTWFRSNIFRSPHCCKQSVGLCVRSSIIQVSNTRTHACEMRMDVVMWIWTEWVCGYNIHCQLHNERVIRTRTRQTATSQRSVGISCAVNCNCVQGMEL